MSMKWGCVCLIAIFLTGCGYDFPHPFADGPHQAAMAATEPRPDTGAFSATEQCSDQAAQRADDAMTRSGDADDTFRQKVYAAAYSECAAQMRGYHR